jgi:hypothetical protein
VLEKERDTLNRKINAKEEELSDKLKEIEQVKIAITKMDKDFEKVQS